MDLNCLKGDQLLTVLHCNCGAYFFFWLVPVSSLSTLSLPFCRHLPKGRLQAREQVVPPLHTRKHQTKISIVWGKGVRYTKETFLLELRYVG